MHFGTCHISKFLYTMKKEKFFRIKYLHANIYTHVGCWKMNTTTYHELKWKTWTLFNCQHAKDNDLLYQNKKSSWYSLRNSNISCSDKYLLTWSVWLPANVADKVAHPTLLCAPSYWILLIQVQEYFNMKKKTCMSLEYVTSCLDHFHEAWSGVGKYLFIEK